MEKDRIGQASVPAPQPHMAGITSSGLLPVTLVIGATAARREAALAALLATGPEQPAAARIALILEGLPDGAQPMRLDPAQNPAILQAARIAPGCFCCIGNLTLRVTLNRMLRQRPSRLYISLATVSHLDQIRALMTVTPYDRWLTLTDDMQVSANDLQSD